MFQQHISKIYQHADHNKCTESRNEELGTQYDHA